MTNPQTFGGGGFQLPPVTPLVRNVLIGLFVLYAVELAFANAGGLPVYALAWHTFGAGIGPWQVLTRYLVQDPGVRGVVIAGIVLYFCLPAMERLFSSRELGEGLVVGAAGGTLLGLLRDA